MKNISNAPDMDRLQNKNLSFITAVFWKMKMIVNPARIRAIKSLIFMVPPVPAFKTCWCDLQNQPF